MYSRSRSVDTLHVAQVSVLRVNGTLRLSTLPIQRSLTILKRGRLLGFGGFLHLVRAISSGFRNNIL